VQLGARALIMLWLFRRRYGGLAGLGVGAMTLKATAASVPVALLAGASYGWLRTLDIGGIMGEVVRVGLPALLGVAAFLAMARLLRIAEVEQLWGAVRHKVLGR
jgi:hypothetical protein